MHGSVKEWCSDWYDKDYYENSDKKDPQDPDNGTRRVLRGGSWVSSGHYCRSAGRYVNEPGNRNASIGFRVVVSAGVRTR
jgi:formylglycine-generating enzyme required for sulfatase activity